MSDRVEDSIDDYKMLEVTAANLPGLDNSNWDGILGLLPSSISGSNLFVTELFKAGILSEDSFGVRYTDTSEGSEITFGGFDRDIVDKIDDFTFVELYDNMHWSAKLGHSKYESLGNLPDVAKSVILDSGTSLILMPNEMFEGLKKLVSLGKKCGHMGVYYG